MCTSQGTTHFQCAPVTVLQISSVHQSRHYAFLVCTSQSTTHFQCAPVKALQISSVHQSRHYRFPVCTSQGTTDFQCVPVKALHISSVYQSRHYTFPVYTSQGTTHLQCAPVTLLHIFSVHKSRHYTFPVCTSTVTVLHISSMHQSQCYSFPVCTSHMSPVLRKPRHVSATSLLRTLHWLPVKARIKYKIACLCFQCLSHNTMPPYLSDLLHPYQPPRTLRSLDTSLLSVPRFCLETFGRRSFSVFGPTVWNSLPSSLRKTQCFSTFKKKLKTHLFEKHLS